MATLEELLKKTNSDTTLKIEYITVENVSEETDSYTNIYRVKNTGQDVGMATAQGVAEYLKKKGVDISSAKIV